jgi:hypothetical protein
MSVHTNHEKTTSENRNSELKAILTETDHHTLRRTVSKKSHNYCSTDGSKTEY